MGQKAITITIRLRLPHDTCSDDQKILLDLAEKVIDEALEEAGFDDAVIDTEPMGANRAEDSPIEEMPTVADLLDDDEDD